jgi:glycosyltransferase involved in cell wall biosynthesis
MCATISPVMPKPKTTRSKSRAKKTPKTHPPLKPTPIKTHKIKILAYGDSPAIPSGFGTVMRNVFRRLAESGRYDIDIFAINDRGNYKDPHDHPYRIYQARNPDDKDFYGRGRFIDAVRGGSIDISPPWDLIFMLNDPFILEEPIPYFKLGVAEAVADIQKTHYRQLPPDMWFKTVGYFPIDSPVKPNWVSNVIAKVDHPVTYSKYGHQEIMIADGQLDQPTGIDLSVIAHGTDTQVFKPLESRVVERFRQEYFAGTLRPDTFLVVTVGRNSNRKDLVRTMKIFREFQKRRPDSFLYIHAQAQGAWGSLEEAANQLGLRQGKDWNFPGDYLETKGVPDVILNGIYNTADVLLSTTQGEGWGLPLTEAMCTKTLVMAPNITAIPEILGTGKLTDLTDINALVNQKIRGIPLIAGKSDSEWVNYGASDLERFRPLTSVEDAVKKLLWVYDHPKVVEPVINHAFKWATKLTWDGISSSWEHLFNQAYKRLSQERRSPAKIASRFKSPTSPRHG